MINKFIGKYEHAAFYSNAKAFADENVVGEIKSKLDAAKDEIKTKELLRPRRLTDANQANERMRNPKVNAHVVKHIMGIFKESSSDERNKNILASTIESNCKGTIMKMWSEFEKAQNEQAKENVIIKYTEQIFNGNLTWVKGIKFNPNCSEHEMIVANQRITNLLLKQYSPATSDKAYDKFCDNYLVKDEKFMDGFMRNNFPVNDMTKDQLAEIMSELKLDLENKQKVNISSQDINAKNVGTSEKKTDVPTIGSRTMIN